MAKWLISFLAILSLFEFSMPCANVHVIKKGELTCKEKESIVEFHNTLRQKVATGKQTGLQAGMNMLEMNWDEKLAEGAQNWANTCSHIHNSLEDRKDARFEVGQNIGTYTSFNQQLVSQNEEEFQVLMQNWYDEMKYFYGYPTDQTGQFTQVIWAETYLIGCGYIYFRHSEYRYKRVFVCNYGPAGSISNTPPYIKGPNICNGTDLTSSSKYPGLCRHENFEAMTC